LIESVVGAPFLQGAHGHGLAGNDRLQFRLCTLGRFDLHQLKTLGLDVLLELLDDAATDIAE
jgi:hypothetical protein